MVALAAVPILGACDGGSQGMAEADAVPERVLRLQEELETGRLTISELRLPAEGDAGGDTTYTYIPDPLTMEGEAELRMVIMGLAEEDGWDESEVELLVARMKEAAREAAEKAQDKGGSR